MKRFLGSIVLIFALALVGFPSVSRADDITVGILSFDPLSTDANGNPVYGIDLTNLTQAGGGSSVSTFLDFTSFTLTLDLSGGGTATVGLSPADPFGDLSTGAVFAGGDVVSATLSGNLPGTVTLADGSSVNINTGSTTFLSDASGPLAAGDSMFVNVTTQTQTAPEPGAALLLAFGFLFLVFIPRILPRCYTWSASAQS